MKLLIDIGHPAHFHLFKNLIIYLKENRHKIIVTSRNKDVTNSLLEHYGIEFICISEPRKNIFGMIFELIQRGINIIQLHIKNNFDASIGSTMSIAHLSAIFDVPSYNFGEDDDDVVPLSSFITFPFSTKIINPESIRCKRWKEKRVFYPSYHELAYLHPNNFTPDENVLKKYKLYKKKYVIARFSALNAYHDMKAKGISNGLWKRLEILFNNYEIVMSIENEKSHMIDPWDMHHLLAFSKMIISDSQTMTIEGSVLGISSIRINTFIGKLTVIDELEKKYKLAVGFFPHEEDKILNVVNAILVNPQTDKIWAERRSKLLADKIDFNNWMIEFFDNQISENNKNCNSPTF